MKYKHVYAAHEARMWIKDVIIPAVSVGLILYSNPRVRESTKDGVGKLKNFVKTKFKKKDKMES